jgi:hypothetical protein
VKTRHEPIAAAILEVALADRMAMPRRRHFLFASRSLGPAIVALIEYG